MLCTFSGLTQREVSGVLNLKSGIPVSCQIRKRRKTLEEDEELKEQLEEITLRKLRVQRK